MSSNKRTLKRNLSRRKKVIMAVVSFLLLCLLAEVGAWIAFRARGKDPSEFVLSPHDPGMIVEGRYISHPFLPFSLRPSSNFTIIWSPPSWPELNPSDEPLVWNIAHNSWGFRGKEVTMNKPPNTLRVLCFGGSTTYDTATDGKSWPEKLEALLQEVYPNRKIQVLNFGMNASSLPFHIVQFALMGVHFQPDLVILYPGHNDLWSGIGFKGFRPDYSHRLGDWDASRRTIQHMIPRWAMKSAFVTAVAVAIDRLRGFEYDIGRQILLRAPKADDPLEGSIAFQKGLITVQGIAKAHGARLLVVTPYYCFRKPEFLGTFLEQIKRTAAEAGIPLFDAANLIPAGDNSLVVDDVHFSEKGGTLFASMLVKAIEDQRLLEEE